MAKGVFENDGSDRLGCEPEMKSCDWFLFLFFLSFCSLRMSFNPMLCAPYWIELQKDWVRNYYIFPFQHLSFLFTFFGSTFEWMNLLTLIFVWEKKPSFFMIFDFILYHVELLFLSFLFYQTFYSAVIWGVGTVCWIRVKVVVLCAHKYMLWNLLLIKVLNNFWYYKHQIPTGTCSEAYL